MNHRPFATRQRSRVATHAWLLATVLPCLLAGCIESNLILCASGLACPASERCDEIHRTCVLPDQLVVCQGIEDGADCVTGPVSGGCFDGVCLARGCGNLAVEPGEMCDDGNQISADGCSEDCRSTERCGNGFVDPGEPCDDGDLVSRDGCDSQCRVEDAAWSDLVGIAPQYINARFTAYDAVRGRLVYAFPEGTWEWDGARWTYHEPRVALSPQSLFYDPERGHVSVIGTDAEGVARLHAWLDGTWQVIDVGNGPLMTGYDPPIVATYDTARHRVIAIDTQVGKTWAIDASGSWSELAAFPGTAPAAAVAFDPVSSHVVLEATDAVEWTFDGTGWASTATSFGWRVSVAFDPERGRLVLIDNESLAMHERIGAAWSVIDGAESPCPSKDFFNSLPLYYEHHSETLVLVGTRAWELCRWDGAWTASRTPVPFNPIGVLHDPATRDFVILHNERPEDPDSPSESWVLGDDGWRQIETATTPSGRLNPLAVYSPGRGATVLYGEQLATVDDGPVVFPCWGPQDYVGDTWTFDGASWTQLASLSRTGEPCSPSAATYDPTNRRILLATYNELWSLGDSDSVWQRMGGTSTGGHVFNLAWDARNGTALATRLTMDASSPLFELRGEDWVPLEVIPNGITVTTNSLVSDVRAGTVLLVDNQFGRTYERTGDEWIRLANAPVRVLFSSWIAYDPSDGSTQLLGRSDAGSFLTTLTRTSATPLEVCRPGEDVDGDGLAGCDDPDCDWTCPVR